MKHFHKILFLVPLLLVACKTADFQRSIDLLTQVEKNPLSKSEVSAGLRSALVQGISIASNQASKLDGYYKNPRLKIPFPAELLKVEKALRSIGLGSEVDRFVQQLNRAAERAAVQAKPIFISAIRSLTIQDAFSILKGGQNAATNYLRRHTSAALTAKILPIVRESLNKTQATRYYGDLVTRYNKIPMVNKINPNLDKYATERAISGLFLLVAMEESNIRANPIARTTELLQRVFGSLDN